MQRQIRGLPQQNFRVSNYWQVLKLVACFSLRGSLRGLGKGAMFEAQPVLSSQHIYMTACGSQNTRSVYDKDQDQTLVNKRQHRVRELLC